MLPQEGWRESSHVQLTVLAPAVDFTLLDFSCPQEFGVSARRGFGGKHHYLLRLRDRISPVLADRTVGQAELSHRLEISHDHATIYSQRTDLSGWQIHEDLPGALFRRRYDVLVGALELSTKLFRRVAAVQLLAMIRYAHCENERTKLERLEQMLIQLETQLHESFTLQDLAQRFGMSPSEFSKAFKSCFGCVPHAYLDLIRIAQGHRYLVHSEQSLADTAYALGYSSQAHFTTSFGRQTGKTPAVYRDRMRIRLEA